LKVRRTVRRSAQAKGGGAGCQDADRTQRCNLVCFDYFGCHSDHLLLQCPFRCQGSRVDPGRNRSTHGRRRVSLFWMQSQLRTLRRYRQIPDRRGVERKPKFHRRQRLLRRNVHFALIFAVSRAQSCVDYEGEAHQLGRPIQHFSGLKFFDPQMRSGEDPERITCARAPLPIACNDHWIRDPAGLTR